MLYFIILAPSVIVLIVSIIFRNAFTRGEKVDKGIELCYYKLSYRRKFIRTLCFVPAYIIIMVFFHITFRSNFYTMIVGVPLGLLFFAQAFYNYVKWKKEE